jgi:hypothetical protein
MSNKLKEIEHDVKKIENLQQKYTELNQLNWKTRNNLKHLQIDYERMMRNYNKMEESNMEHIIP